jgi:SAM-dependent methyltransferase
MKCPLCHHSSEVFYLHRHKHYYFCTNCFSISLCEHHRLEPEHEKQHYTHHKNNVEDLNYQQFVSPITSQIKKDFDKLSKGLDFGCGTGPVIQHILHKEGYKIDLYDHYFYPNTEIFDKKYDFIVASEVVEHFYHPDQEFSRLHQMLKPGGKLYIMTELFSEKKCFDAWYYKNDPTHVFFYNKKTMQWISNKFGFHQVENNKRLTVFTK